MKLDHSAPARPPQPAELPAVDAELEAMGLTEAKILNKDHISYSHL